MADLLLQCILDVEIVGVKAQLAQAEAEELEAREALLKARCFRHALERRLAGLKVELEQAGG